MLVVFVLVVVMPFHVFADLFAGHISREEGRPGVFGIDDRVEALVAHPDVEVFGGGRFDHVVVELNVDRRAGILVLRLKAIHGRLRAGRPVLNVIADILVVRADLLAIFVGELDVVTLNIDVGNVRFVAVLIVGLVFFGGHFAFLCHRCKRIIQRSVQHKGIGRLPVARPIRQASVLNLVIFKGGDFLAVVMVVICFLHTLDHFFCLDAVAKDIQQVDDFHVLVGGIFQSIVHPAVGLAAHIDEQVTVGDFDNVIGSGLIAVQVNAVIKQHRDFGVIGFVT